MYNKGLKKLRVFSVLGLALIMMLSSIVPVMAQDVNELEISTWAIPELNEVEKYGVYPMYWYMEGFLQPISSEKLDYLLEKTDEKLENLGLEKDDSFKALDYKEDGTRKEVITRLYNLLGQYKALREDIRDLDAVDYFKENNMVLGSYGDLKLEEKANVEQSVLLAKRTILHVYDLLGEGAEGFLWEVKKNNNTVYLLGSIHIGDTMIYPMNKNLREKFMNSDFLLLEANLMNPQGFDEFIQSSTYIDGTSLKDHIDAELYEKTIKALEEKELPVEAYTQLKPWRIANDLSLLMSSENQTMEKATENAALGIDIYFNTNAMLMGKPIIELEGLKYQGDLFNSLSEEAQEEYLNGVLDEILNKEEAEVEVEEVKEVESNVKVWIEQWKNGDVEGFRQSYAKTLEETSNEEFTQMLLGKRDEGMANKIAELLEGEEGKTYFVVVGSAHLVVEDTVIDKLVDKGYEVKSLNK